MTEIFTAILVFFVMCAILTVPFGFCILLVKIRDISIKWFKKVDRRLF